MVSTSNLPYMMLIEDPAEHIKVGSFYEIDHSKLPPKFPDQLNSIRIVMVNEKTRMRVSLRYPSIYSLRAYFSETTNTHDYYYYYYCSLNMKSSNNQSYKAGEMKKIPGLDEKYTIGSEVAEEALYRRIPPDEIAQKRQCWSFWARLPLFPNGDSFAGPGPGNGPSLCLLSELKSPGMLQWGKRKLVQFLSRNVEENKTEELVGNLKDESETEEEEEEEEVVKRPRGEEQKQRKNKIVVYNKKRKRKQKQKNSIARWSQERYKLAEMNMLKVMKEKGAEFGKPILRPDLRSAARRLIGDTGLLDHLLKHMAGKVAPGGEDRFRRRHNADGAMEYWLEKADLFDIRTQAGIQDPYWIPPPGWMPGDNPTRDPICVRDILDIKYEIDKLKKDMEVLVPKKLNQELAIVVTPSSTVTSQTTEPDGLLTPLKETYIDLVNKKAKIEEQLRQISLSLCEMEEEIGRSKSTLEESNRILLPSERPTILVGSLGSTAAVGTEKERRELVLRGKGKTKSEGLLQEQSKARLQTPLTEDKAAKIERLKSGFRICKPQGTFLWPDMAISSHQLATQLEDLVPVPTPPSVSSYTLTRTPPLLAPTSSDQHRPTSPLKPLAEMRPVPIAPSAVVTLPIPSPSLEITHTKTRCANQSITTSTPFTTSTTTRTTLINLNDPPDNPNDNVIYGSQSHVVNSTYPVTYHRRHQHNLMLTAALPCLTPKKNEMEQWDCGEPGKEMMIRHPEQQQRGYSSNSSGSPSFSMGGGTWLALTTSKPSEDNKSTRG